MTPKDYYIVQHGDSPPELVYLSEGHWFDALRDIGKSWEVDQTTRRLVGPFSCHELVAAMLRRIVS